MPTRTLSLTNKPLFPLLSRQEAISGCGIGLRSMCCIYVVVTPEGLKCGRETELRSHLEMMRDGSAKRRPTEAYPDCQLTGKF